MIEPLNPDDTREHVLLSKINEIIEVVNGTYLSTALEATEAKEPYCSQAEEALKQVAQLERTFDNHYHSHGEMTGNTSSPLITMIDERDE